LGAHYPSSAAFCKSNPYLESVSVEMVVAVSGDDSCRAFLFFLSPRQRSEDQTKARTKARIKAEGLVFCPGKGAKSGPNFVTIVTEFCHWNPRITKLIADRSSFGFGVSRFKDSLSEAQERREAALRRQTSGNTGPPARQVCRLAFGQPTTTEKAFAEPLALSNLG
jgi:hypothetical protein